MEHKILPFSGAATALVTPFCADGSVDFAALERLIEFQIENRTDALLFLGTTGEASTLSERERSSVISFAVEKVARRVPVIIGTGSNDTAHAVRLTQEACRLGADSVLVVTPYYNKCSEEGLFAHYAVVAEASTRPVILYTVPSRTGVHIPLPLYRRLAALENVVAVKEASGNLSSVCDVCAEIGEGLHVYSGNDELTLPVLSLGGKGVISVAGNLVPGAMHDLCRSFFDGDMGRARQIQHQLTPLIHGLFSEVNPIPVKAALSLMGLCGSTMRLPLSPLSEAKEASLKKTLSEYGLI